MKKSNAQIVPKLELLCGKYTKREAVGLIAAGTRHVHSTTLGERDPAAKETAEAISKSAFATYGWEPKTGLNQIRLVSSADRQSVIDQAVSELKGRRSLREKVQSVLEELITNSLYHAYRLDCGSEKYPRKSGVKLEQNETLSIFHRADASGFYLSVTDQAGTLAFQDIASALHRCYESENPILAKDNGAGLGTYMVFDAATHFKIATDAGKSTVISCWISDTRTFDPEYFSFNYFERRRP